ncbi:hypothetical protein SVIO_026330 [Streptomyces violaceusniger]|uniref:Uncharacterized protein n=1 Tax=Streptomyces violaceusniger TaxID=68280 RepID=A0A4D4KZN9_STRVO|nr:hypothetical protein SVIO_026330 [Streptomyces violaceusniger]
MVQVLAPLHQSRADQCVEKRRGTGLRHIGSGHHLVESEGRGPVQEGGKAEALGDLKESGVRGQIGGGLPGVGPVHASLPNRGGYFSK